MSAVAACAEAPKPIDLSNKNVKLAVTMSTSSLASIASDGTNGNSVTAAPSFSLPETSDKCPRCKVLFDFIKRVNVSKVPLILNCKHTVCEDCIRRMAVINNAFCPVCREPFTVLRTQIDNLTELFQPHYAEIGRLVWLKNSPTKRQLGWVSSGRTLGNKNLTHDLPELNFELLSVKSDADDDCDFDKPSLCFVFDKCLEHTDQFLNIQCNPCDSIICSYCFVEYHLGHPCTPLYKISEEEMENLLKVRHEVELIFAQLLATKKKVKELKNFDSSSLEHEIRKYFFEVHAKIHLAERNLKKKLSKMTSEESDLEVVKDTLQTGIYKVNQILNFLNSIKPDSKEFNLKALYNEALSVREIPCRLVSDQGVLQPIEFVADEVLDNIEECLTLRSLPAMEYTLMPIEDWNYAEEKYEMEKMKRKTGSPIERKSEDLPNNKNSKPNLNKGMRERAGKIRVQVTHLNDLNSFFVQKYTALESLRDMNTSIGRKNKNKKVDNPKIGKVYGVLYTTRNITHWRRGKLIDIITSKKEGTQYKMYFIDYGNSQAVSVDKIKEIDVRTSKRLPFCFECKLSNPDGITFDEKSHMLLPQLIGEKELYLHYVNDKQAERSGPQEVELLVPTANGGFISVLNLLTQSLKSVPDTNNATLYSELKLFKNSRQLLVGQEEEVMITYVRDPSYIGLILAQNTKILEKMKTEMAKYYQDKPQISCIPVEDFDVVVRFDDEEQGNWHRAKICSVNIPKKQVVVFFVDWGRSEVVPWSCVKELTEEFIKIECQVIIVKLADIDHSDDAWSQETVDFLRDNIQPRDVYKIVTSNGEPLEVALFQRGPAADICINALLVERKLAISVGPLSSTLLWPNMLEERPLREEDDDFAFQMVKKSEKILLENQEDFHLKFGLCEQVTVVQVQSPDLICIKLKKFDEMNDELHKDLQISYGDCRRNKSSWKTGENCVIFDSIKHCYFRGCIKSQTKSDNYLVYLYDHGREMKVHKNMIFVQEPYFKRYTAAIFKCSLARIKPAGDPGKWSSLAIEMLQKICSIYKTFYIKKVLVSEEDKKIGVLMWYCLNTPAKALEPSKMRYISINQSLIEAGVAFSAQPNDKTKTFEVEEKEICDDTESDKKDWYDLICEEDELLTTEQKTWLEPCFKIEETEFNANLVCVNSEGHFAIRNEEVESLYQDMEENLTAKFNTMEVTSELTSWQVNDMCTVAYEGKWYRGTVLAVLNNEEISVEMIDFGSEHTVRKSSLTKYIMFPEFPPMIQKVQLHDVISKYGAWRAEDVDELIQLATAQIRVVIKSSLPSDMPYAEIYLSNGLSINDLITQKCPHMYRTQNTVVLASGSDFESTTSKEELDCDKDELTDYVYAPFPEAHEKQKMQIVSVLKSGTSFNVVLDNNKFDENLDEFVALKEDIQNYISEQPILEDIWIDQPCVCLHDKKNVWCRAKIYFTNSDKNGLVLVFFVDYGYVEMANPHNLRKMKPEWFNLPVSIRIATLNIELVDLGNSEYIVMKMNELKGKTVLVEVISESPLKVHLYDGPQLCYQNFIQCGFIKTL